MVYYSLSSYNNDMFLAGILSWWYSDGLSQRFNIMLERLASTGDMFSIKLLVKTIFRPFKMISADSSGSMSLSDHMRDFFDKLLSCTIGAIVRITTIFIGLIIMILQLLLNVIVILFWLLVPLTPVVGIILTILNWMFV